MLTPANSTTVSLPVGDCEDEEDEGENGGRGDCEGDKVEMVVIEEEVVKVIT